jgi:hypothetical protein
MHIRNKQFALATALCLCAGGAVAGDPPIAIAEQVAIDYGSGAVFGDAVTQRFAQTFQVRGDGYITHLMVPVNCMTAPEPTLTVSIQTLDNFGRPSGNALAVQRVRGWRVDSVPGPVGEVGMRMIPFDRPVRGQPGLYAFVLEAAGSSCQIWYGPLGDTYAAGEAWLDGSSRLLLHPWGMLLPRDLTFQVYWKGL